MPPPTPSVQIVSRRSRVLTPSPIQCLARLPTINLTAGCLHDCAYCYIAGYSGYPGKGAVVLYGDTAQRLEHELARRRSKPRAVYFSPSSDLFQPHPAIQTVAEDVLRVLFAHEVGVAFLTKGEIPAHLFDLIAANSDRVQAQIGITSLDPTIAATLEPGAAAPDTRIRQAAALLQAGVPVDARLDPILPGLTDDEASLDTLFAAIAAAGVESAAAGVLFLRPHIARALRAAAAPSSRIQTLLDEYERGPRLTMRGTSSAVASLPPQRRQVIFARVTQAGARHGVRVRVCACKNDDITGGACNIAGRWPTAESRDLTARQPALPGLQRFLDACR